MFSAEDERVDMVKQIDPKKKNVEHWLGEVEQGMKDTVKHMMIEAVKDYPKRKRKVSGAHLRRSSRYPL
jgi:dynein heavy chain